MSIPKAQENNGETYTPLCGPPFFNNKRELRELSRSGYSDDCTDLQLKNWRGAVTAAIRGKRGQAFLREMLAALDALPQKRLISDDLEKSGEVCAIGSVGAKRGTDMSKLDPYDRQTLADVFGIAPALVAEIEFINDEHCFPWYVPETPEHRFDRVRKWVVEQIKEVA